MKMLSVAMILEAEHRIRKHIRQTPLEYSPKLSTLLSVPVHLKLEALQQTGSFKLRGALYRLSCLTEQEKRKGIVACSAGNHGKAVAYVSKLLGIKAKIYVPRDVDEAKYQGILSYGAEVIRAPSAGYDDTEELAKRDAQSSEKPYISPFDDVETMAGNGGTLAIEVLEKLPEARSFILPVGAGGLAAGFSVYAKEKLPDVRVIGCQHKDCAALKLSLQQGRAITKMPAIRTVAGGLEGGIGANCFAYLRTRIDEVVLVSEEEIIEGVRWMLMHHQLLVEPSAAVVIAACITHKLPKLSTPTVIVLSGRNLSYNTLKSLV